MKHPDFEFETQRLEETITHIEHTITAVEDYRVKYKDNIKSAMSNLDYQESSTNYIEVLMNTQFVEIADRNYDQLLRARKKPYFARIDFKQEDNEKIEKLYIGKTSLLKDGSFTPMVIDWRAPIASLYYEGRLGECSYESEGDVYKGELSLKRQIAIENGRLENFIDVDITTNDAFLQASLEASADQRLKDIASTIQAEQNRVIRANMRRPLIVQGVAGSGKTTIALHRIAYFIYTYEKHFKPESFMIIAPNRLFINYISEVLPELGVEKVKQTTFVDFMTELIGKKIQLLDRHQKLMTLVHENDASLTASMRSNTAFKGSLGYKEGIESYLKHLEKNLTPSVHFEFFGEVVTSRVEIRQLFLENFSYLPFNKRIHEIKRLLTTRLKAHYKKTVDETSERYNLAIDRILKKEDAGEERRTQVVTLMDERDALLGKMAHAYKTAVKSYMARFPVYDPFQVHYTFNHSADLLKTYFGSTLSDEQIAYHIALTESLSKRKVYELEDLAALLYIKHRIQGFESPVEVTTLVIDEAQDFSLFQFFVLKHVLKTPRLTLLGDLSQGIHDYRGIQNWDEVMTQVFDGDEPSYMTLVQSYRTTVEIMDLANRVLASLKNPGLIYAQPVIRHGDAPNYFVYEKRDHLISQLHERINRYHHQGYRSIAIICKDLSECKAIKRLMSQKGSVNIKILDEKEEHYSAGVILVPSYFAKGLEFDVVLITALDAYYGISALEIKLLYVAMTRALHRLDILTMEGHLPLMDELMIAEKGIQD